ncbi:Dyp-type peroxidase [Nonomuraea sp. NBC_01738]|uniref:Dyp-type peroxidase n=1 Tax=Nonomuraea sp. NBC_01738 TaxID=2976003 RepID=UPI002E11D309|nr:Dyp-type peroxidase [Nonomuraea sp. NBC_01738]
MGDPQPVLTPLSRAAIFLVLVIREGRESVVRDVLADLTALQRTVGFRAPDGGLACVTGIGSMAWDRLFAGPRPAELHPFRELAGPRHRAVSTQGDLLIHLRAARMDLCFEMAGLIMDRLTGAATVVDETHGFAYFDERDLMGFVDGTENPTGQAAKVAVTSADPHFAGGSYVIVQKYLHDLTRWNALPVEAQELIIGRTKLSNVELPDDVKPPTSHVASTSLDDGREIMRFNMPFGEFGRGEFGTYFIGYSDSPSVTELMLERMFLGDALSDGDRILDFSTAVTGTLFFAPTADFLDNLPDAPGAADVPMAQRETEQSLGVGSLKGSR